MIAACRWATSGGAGPRSSRRSSRLHDGVIGRVWLAESWYTNQPPVDRQGPAGAGAGGSRLRPVARPGSSEAVSQQLPALQLALVLELGQRRTRQQRHPHARPLPLGPGSRLPDPRHLSGGRYRFDDDQETPDTHTVAFDFGGRQGITWDGLSCGQKPSRKTADMRVPRRQGPAWRSPAAVTRSTTSMARRSARNRPRRRTRCTSATSWRPSGRGKPLNAEIGEGHKSTLLCHLGNIAHRTGRGADVRAEVWTHHQ